jgi:hypothetical protein
MSRVISVKEIILQSKEVTLMAKKSATAGTCVPDADRLAVFKDCQLTYGMDDRAPDSEWPHNVIAKSAVAYSCGRFGFPWDGPSHDHDPEEFALCRRLAEEVAAVMKYACGLGCNFERYLGYFCVAQRGEPVAAAVTPAVIRRAFRDTIYPPTKIEIEPMSETARWWKWAVENASGEDEVLAPHRQMLAWFKGKPELRKPAFVYIGDDPLDDTNTNMGGVFPRLAVALTRAGSLVGVGGWMAD